MSKPIVCEIKERVDDDFSQSLEEIIKEGAGDKSKFLLNYPAVYIHDYELDNGKHTVYIGESNDVIKRTSDHYFDRRFNNKWQHSFFTNKRELKMYVIGHEHFNKSMTLDIENKIINYMMSASNIERVLNSRSNPQNKYYPIDEFDEIFGSVWSELRKKNKSLFLSRAKIEDSAIFKASPLHRLSIEQEIAKRKILVTINNALGRKLDNQLIIVQGEAGTGKTVLTSRTFYELLQQNSEEETNKINCCLMVNHDEQIKVYEQIVKKLSIKNNDGSEVVYKPTHFINTHSKENKIDVAFIDEGHLLLTRGKQAYKGKNQLDDIMERARVTVVMFDPNQVLKSEQYWEPSVLEEKLALSESQNNRITLFNQMRLKAGKETIEWINNITLYQTVSDLGYDSTGYDIKVFDTPEELYNAIKQKSQNKESALSRLIATYDWEYSSINKPNKGKTWDVKIGNFVRPWNRELFRYMSTKEKRIIKDLAWAEQPQTINEIGSTYTIQGFDLSYAGVIIGPSVQYRNGKIVFDAKSSHNDRAKEKRTLSDGSKYSFSEEFIKNELRVLLTRGVNGLYIYAVDDELREEIKKSIIKNQFLRDFKKENGNNRKD